MPNYPAPIKRSANVPTPSKSTPFDNVNAFGQTVDQQAIIVLLDVSGSMDEMVYGKRKIDLLRSALRSANLGNAECIAFSSSVYELKSLGDIPEPHGSTALEQALMCCYFKQPHTVLVISDGHPDKPESALECAKNLECQINVLFIGDESDTEGAAFMNALANVSRRGRCVLNDPKKKGIEAAAITALLK